jgi:glycosyltransferase involved in cell wall biosynthesis
MLQAAPYTDQIKRVGLLEAQVTVCISLFNYEDYIVETLDSVHSQSLDLLNLIVVDDCSVDRSLKVALDWLEQNSDRFNAVQLVQHQNNQGLAQSRNTALSLLRTPFAFILDADNLLYPRCIDRCVEAIEASNADFVYPITEKFGAEIGIMCNEIWDSEKLAYGNYIDAMALLRSSSVTAVGGYSAMLGWEDYDLWCKFAEKNYYGVLVPEILARYRVHKTSMLRTITNKADTLKIVCEAMTKEHPWLRLKI